MKAAKTQHVLPDDLLKEIQKYVQGESIYIPKLKSSYQKWGSRSGGRKRIEERNARIREAFKNGCRVDRLAEDYFLSPETIKKIVYSK
ncbi:CD3324 family protein [Rossellomorea vietnamensis]|uniref:CD3324 family protein n=1 Tax=Rossellomorea vietnamensis TaxID=218284 RepID=UPI003CF434F0